MLRGLSGELSDMTEEARIHQENAKQVKDREYLNSISVRGKGLLDMLKQEAERGVSEYRLTFDPESVSGAKLLRVLNNEGFQLSWQSDECVIICWRR